MSLPSAFVGNRGKPQRQLSADQVRLVGIEIKSQQTFDLFHKLPSLFHLIFSRVT